MQTLLTHFLLILLCGQAASQTLQPIKVLVRGLELHYIEQGQGEPLSLSLIRLRARRVMPNVRLPNTRIAGLCYEGNNIK